MIDTRVVNTRVPVRRGHLTAVSLLGLLLALTGCSNNDDSGTTSSTTAVTATPSTGAATGAATGTATGTGTSPGPSSSAASRIVIKNFTFNPAKLTVKAGASVTVVNQDATAHTVTATGSGTFNTGDIAPGSTVTFTAPGSAGTYPYICNIHPFMKGALTVR